MATIELETLVRAPIARVFDLARDIDFHTRSMEHTGERAVAGCTSGLIGLGEEVEWEARHFGLNLRLRTRITRMEPPSVFVDEQVKGAFVSIVHRHEFVQEGALTRMTDHWVHVAPLGFLVDPLFLTAYMTRLLERRNVALKLEAEGGPEGAPADEGDVRAAYPRAPRRRTSP